MAQPTPYNPTTDFSAWQALYPSDPIEGTSLDTEFANINTTLDETLANLALIQRDDGAIANTSVGRDQLKAEVVQGINTPAAWVTATAYTVRDSVIYDNKWYWCGTAHTSTSFASDIANWTEITDFSVLVAGPDVAAVEADLVSVEADLSAAESDLAAVEAASTDAASVEADHAAVESDLAAIEADLTAVEADLVAVEADIAVLPSPGAGEYGSIIVQNDADNGFELLNQGPSGTLLRSYGTDALPVFDLTTEEIWATAIVLNGVM